MRRFNLATAVSLSAALFFMGFSQPLAAEDVRDQFDYSVSDISANLVTINCEHSGHKTTGCGFIALMEGKPYLITSQHLLLGTDKIQFTSPTGRTIKPRSVELSASRDIARLALSEGEGFSISADPAMGTPIGIFDQSTAFHGKITGVGASIIEVSAEFDDEYCGSPVLNLDQEVIGVASYVRESRNHSMKTGTRFENSTRRFCYRIDQVDWEKVNWKRFNKKYGIAFREGQDLLDTVIAVLNSWAEGPLEEVSFESSTDKALDKWVNSHNAVVSQSPDNGRREFYIEYASSTQKLAAICRAKARELRILYDQRGITDYLSHELDSQAGTLEFAAKVIDQYSESTFH